MKYLLVILSGFFLQQIKAQTDTLSHAVQQGIEKDNFDYHTSYTKSVIRLMDHRVLHTIQATIHNSELTVEYDPKKIPPNPVHTIPVENISYITFRRAAFVKGLVVGAGIGAIVGTLYLKSHADETYSLNRTLYTLSGIVALGVTGGIAGSVFLKKKFKINGDKERLRRIFIRM